MAILPLNLARVSNTLRMNVATQNLTRTQQSLLDVQNQLATGQRINTPSDDPTGAGLVMQLNKTLNKQNLYLANITQGSAQLGEADSTLGSMLPLLQQAQQIASKDVGSDITAEQRQTDANVIQSIYTQMLNMGNTQFEGSYIFGGVQSNQPPFVEQNGGVQFVGSTQVQSNYYDEGTVLPYGVSGADVFGGLSAPIAGADLSPAMSLNTRLTDLRGTSGDGIRLGSIQISNGATSKVVDLSTADTVGDVINAINGAGVGSITAAIGSDGKSFTISGSPTDNISITEAGTGSTASDLGIINATGAGAGTPVNGTDVSPRVTLHTPLSALKGGAGIDFASGLILTNGLKSATVTFSNTETIQDLINKINGSGTGAQAQINAAGNGIDILNPVSGASLSVAENGGTTAADLGVRSYSPSTLLSQLNGGAGVKTVAGGDLLITRSDGTNFTVSLSSAKTVQDAIDAINAADGGNGVTASFSTTGNGIVLKDTTSGPGTLRVSEANFSTAAADLGLTTPATGNVITGTDVNPVTTNGIFSNLLKLQKALQTGTQQDITAAAQGIQADIARVTLNQGKVGASEQQLNATKSRLQDQTITTQSLLSNIQDVDYNQAITQFQTLQTTLQATLQTAGKMLNQSLLDFLQ
jgi:flagellar hook-associated protein 3 FlgL